MARPILNSREKKEILQPIDPKTGYVNEDFNRAYGADKNPYMGTERDRSVSRSKIYTRTGTSREKGIELERQKKAKEKRYGI
jgi:hypothetical protein